MHWAIELQSVAQSGLFYGKDKFDIESYQRIRDISAEMISYKTVGVMGICQWQKIQ
ncbi:MAG: NUDIX hydrolase N-terminal domain-containing protein [Ruminococcus flavefaciens]|nr:NUDIX hydrolase N-terminal domain-containing protein [Ruminococcus flavefaciens]